MDLEEALRQSSPIPAMPDERRPSPSFSDEKHTVHSPSGGSGNGAPSSTEMAADGALRQIHSHTLTFTGHSQCGFLFDVTAKAYDIAVSAVCFVPGAQDGEYDIWLAKEKHEKVHQNSKAWTLVAQGTHSAAAQGTKLTVQLGCHVTIPRRQSYAFYISGRNVNAICFSTENRYNNSAENEDVIIHLGHFKAFPWEGVLSTGPFGHNGMQEFVGALEYQVLQSSAADHVVETVARLWKTRPFPDAELVASNGKRFSVHRVVLAAASPHLNEAFLTLTEKPSYGEVPCLTVDVSSETLESLLHFMYTGSEGNTTDPGEMLKLAHLYSLHALVRSCAARLANNLSTSNAISSIRALRPYRDHPACLAAWQMMITNVQLLLSDNPQVLQDVLLAV